MPENLRTEENLVLLLKKDPKQAADIPKHYWTHSLLTQTVEKYGGILKHIDPANVPEDFIIDLAKKENGYGGREFEDFFFNHSLPDAMKTPNVVRAFVVAGSVPIKQIPPKMLIDNVVLKRLIKHSGEATDIPPEMWSKDFALKLINLNPDTMAAVPESSYSEPLLYTWLRKLAISHGADPDSQEYTAYQPMAFAAMDNFASVAAPQMYGNGRAYSHNDTTIKDALLRIPKRVWSKRVALRAVGNVIPLKAVPPKWRDDQMIKLAIERDPSTVTMLPDRLVS
ncbi:unnamed protein product [Sphagnum tenellum]